MIISQTPLRLSFVGGGTDFSDFYQQHRGHVISATIDKYIYVIVKKRYDDLIVLHYTDNEVVSRVEDVKHEIIKEALKLTHIEKGIEIITLADITTKGSGLGSSSVLTVGLLNALYHYLGTPLTNEQLANAACRIEIEQLRKPIGKQDQYIAAYGGTKKIVFNKDETVVLDDYDFSETQMKSLAANLLLYNTGITRRSEDILTEQKSKMISNTEELLTISGLVDKLDIAFKTGDMDKLGDLLKVNWEMKRKLASNISIPSIDEMVAIAYENGASGCKIVGAGGGGFLMSYVPAERQRSFRQSMNGYHELQFSFDPRGTRILLNSSSGIN